MAIPVNNVFLLAIIVLVLVVRYLRWSGRQMDYESDLEDRNPLKKGSDLAMSIICFLADAFAISVLTYRIVPLHGFGFIGDVISLFLAVIVYFVFFFLLYLMPASMAADDKEVNRRLGIMRN